MNRKRHEYFAAVHLVHMNGRMYDTDLRRFLSPDNYVQDPTNTQNYNRYQYGYNNPLKYSDPSGEFFFAAIIIGAIIGAAVGAGSYVVNAIKTGHWSWKGLGSSILKGAIAGGIGGLIMPGAVMGSLLSNGIGGAIGMGILANSLPSLHIPIGDFSIDISPAIAFGKSFSIGANIRASYRDGNFNASVGFGVSFAGSAAGSGAKGWEYRSSYSVGYNDGKFSTSVYSTYFSGSSQDASQRVGGLSLGYRDWNLRYENDGAPFNYLGGILVGKDSDRYRTAAMILSYKDYSIGFNLFTGDPKLDKNRGIEPLLEHPDLGFKEGGQYAGINASKYRLGAAYIGYKGYQFGRNSEGIRNLIQNEFAHKKISYQPYFKVLPILPENYFQYRSYNSYTLW